MKSYRVRNIKTGRTFWVREDHLAFTHPDFEVITLDAVEGGKLDFTSWSLDDLRAFAVEQGIDLGKLRVKASIVKRIEDATA